MLEGLLRIYIVPETKSENYHQLRTRGWLWLVEMHGRSNHKAQEILFDVSKVVPARYLQRLTARPETSQVVGVVRFGEKVVYSSKSEWDIDVGSHYIPPGHVSGWRLETTSRVGRRVAQVYRVSQPQPVEGRWWIFCQSQAMKVTLPMAAIKDVREAVAVKANDSQSLLGD